MVSVCSFFPVDTQDIQLIRPHRFQFVHAIKLGHEGCNTSQVRLLICQFGVLQMDRWYTCLSSDFVPNTRQDFVCICTDVFELHFAFCNFEDVLVCYVISFFFLFLSKLVCLVFYDRYYQEYLFFFLGGGGICNSLSTCKNSDSCGQAPKLSQIDNWHACPIITLGCMQQFIWQTVLFGKWSLNIGMEMGKLLERWRQSYMRYNSFFFLSTLSFSGLTTIRVYYKMQKVPGLYGPCTQPK